MYKRRMESSSSVNNTEDESSQSSECYGGTADNNSRSGPLSTGIESRKRARNDIAEQRQQRPVASTSSQFQTEGEITLKEEIEENDDVAEYTDVYLAEGMYVTRSRSMGGQQSQPKVERSRGERFSSKIQQSSKHPKEPLPSNKTSVPKPHEKYFEGCLVTGGILTGYPYWPGIIRKPDADDKHANYSRERGGKISLFVQFFTDPTTVGWLQPWELRVFDVGKPNRCKILDPIIVVKFEKAVRIATAAANIAVEARLAKFSLPNEAEIDNLLDEIGLNINHAANDVLVPEQREKYFEGCLVMGFTGCKGYPFWPGMIRKAFEDLGRPDYTIYEEGKTWLYAQYFKEPTTVHWMTPRDLAVFDAVKPNQCYHRNSAVVVKFEKAVKIAKAAANYSVETRLEKFTLLTGAAIDGLLAEIDNVNSDQPTTAEPRTRQDGTPTENSDSAASTSQGNGGSNTDLVAPNGSTHRTNGNGESCPDSFEIMIEERMSKNQKLLEDWIREKDVEIQRLTTDNAKLTEENNKLTLTVKKQAIFIVDLQEKQEKEKLEHKTEVENEKQKWKTEVENERQKWKTEVENEKQKWKIEVEKEKLELKQEILEIEKGKLELKQEVEKEKQEKLKYKQESEKRKALLEKAVSLKSITQS